jgi:hypothetical protein
MQPWRTPYKQEVGGSIPSPPTRKTLEKTLGRQTPWIPLLGYAPQKEAMDEFADGKGVKILTLPTGQGLLLKPARDNVG